MVSKNDELRHLQSTHSNSLLHNQKVGEELKKTRDELRKLQASHSKKKVEATSLKAECNKLREDGKVHQTQANKLESQLQQRELELKAAETKLKELEVLKAKIKEKEAQCEMLTATRDNLLHRLDKMEKLEMDYELLKHHVQEALGQSSQLKNDNKALLNILKGVEVQYDSFA